MLTALNYFGQIHINIIFLKPLTLSLLSYNIMTFMSCETPFLDKTY